MAKQINKLTPLKVKQLKKSGWYADGEGLYLQVSKSGSKSWVYRYKTAGKENWYGLGGYSSDNSLKDARISASECRKLRSKGIDPVKHKRQLEAQKKLNNAKTMTFKDCALAFIELHKTGWKNSKHEMYWRNTLNTYAYPVIGDLPIQDIDTGLVLAVIEPIWSTKTETASRIRQRIEKILDWAKVRDYREGENPARWRGHLSVSLPKPTKISKVKHFKAMPYKELPAYFRQLRLIDTVASKVIAFTILTTLRPVVARECLWSEIDTENKLWVIPAKRMKIDTDNEHRVPLSDEALKIINEVKGRGDDFLFPSIKHGQAISEATIRKLIKKLETNGTLHGFRSTFRDWCAEMTTFPHELAEKALAHSVGNATEAAYQRGDMLAKRQRLMTAWSDYCTTASIKSDVIPISKVVNK